MQAELNEANQTLVVKRNEITQLNQNNARLVAESGATGRSPREARAHSEKIRETLDRMLAEHVRAETEREALCPTGSAQIGELENTRAALRAAAEERTKLAAPIDAQRLLLAGYQAHLGLGAAVG